MASDPFKTAASNFMQGLQLGPLKVFRPEDMPPAPPAGLTPTYPIDKHLHVELAMLSEGEGAMIVEGHRYELKTGETFLFLPLTAHAECFSSKSRSYKLMWVSLGGTSASASLSVYEPDGKGRRSLDGRVIVTTDSALKLFSLCERIHASGELSKVDLARLHGVALLLACDMVDALEKKGVTAGSELVEHSVNQALAYIAENYMRAISVKDVAKLLRLSPNYLNATFKRKTGKPLLRCIIDMRIEAAKKLLAEGSMPVKSVAKEIGMDDPLYFCRVFKARTGFSPSEWQERKGF